MAYTKALHVSANTLCPWLPEQKCIKRAAWKGNGYNTFEGISKSNSHHSDFMKRRRKGENYEIVKLL